MTALTTPAKTPKKGKLKPAWRKGESGNTRGRPPGTGYKQRALGSVMGMLAGADGDAYLGKWMRRFRDRAMKDGTAAERRMTDVLVGTDVLDQIDAWLDRGERREKDFLSYQLHKAATDIQRRILFTLAKYLFLMAGRRSGKSHGLRAWFADEFVQKPDARCLYIGLTIHKAMDLLWQPMLDTFERLDIKVKDARRTDGEITTEAGGTMKFGGNSSKDEREKNRGPWWDRVAIDEAQSQKELLYLIESILTPTLIDTKGQLAVAGTGPRVRGTYWEALFMGQWADGRSLYPEALRLNWNIAENPYIDGYETVLAELRAEKALKETDSLYQREYLGRCAYDDDALVLRFNDDNAFADEQLAAWLKAGPAADVRFVAGLDFGFESSDALAIVCYSRSRPERWLVWEYKANRIGTAELAVAIRAGLDYVSTSPLFGKVGRECTIYADTGGNAITPYDLSQQYKLPIQSAYKAEKDMAVELLQDETRRRALRVRRGGPLWEEALRTVYARDDQDALTRKVDDETYHPDMIPALAYAMRDIWLFGKGDA